LLSGTWLTVNLPLIIAATQSACSRRDEGAEFTCLSEDEAVELEAIAAQIIPTDDTPGASEAGVIYFIDEALAGFLSSQAPLIRRGLEDLQGRLKGGGYFSELPFDRQTKLLKSIEGSGFFTKFRELVIIGMFALPDYGGNADKIGWKLLGFEDRHGWQPPFGYYDANIEVSSS
jgi:gluconate 2-dehydrogenase gamma chain